MSTVDDATGVINPGPFSKYVDNSLQGNTIVAGSGFIMTMQASDQYGNPVNSYSGPTSVMATTTPVDPLGDFPQGGTLANGFGFLLGILKTAGTYTLNSAAGGFSGTSSTVTVVPGNAAYFTVSAPATFVTGIAVSVTVTAYDPYGNIATGYSGSVQLTGVGGEHCWPRLITSQPVRARMTARIPSPSPSMASAAKRLPPPT